MLNSQLDPFASREPILRTPDVQQPQQQHQTTSMFDAVRAVATTVGGGPNSMPNAPSSHPQMPQPDYSGPTPPPYASVRRDMEPEPKASLSSPSYTFHPKVWPCTRGETNLPSPVPHKESNMHTKFGGDASGSTGTASPVTTIDPSTLKKLLRTVAVLAYGALENTHTEHLAALGLKWRRNFSF